jgi:hypothetical protein
MADLKFLDKAGIKQLWKNVVKKVSSSVDAERARAEAEEARIESLILSGGGGASADITEGEGIDIVLNENGQQVISLEKNSINDEHIESISISKVTLKDGDTLILNGGNANG